jgi:hypothetical protein
MNGVVTMRKDYFGRIRIIVIWRSSYVYFMRAPGFRRIKLVHRHSDRLVKPPVGHEILAEGSLTA